LTISNIYTVTRNTFYYGTFEYPRGSDNWYQGLHEPLITKELFDRVQETLQGRYVPKTESKEFAFTKLITCGTCQSGITADEKFKKLKDGSVNRYVYYRCTKSKDSHCKNKPLNETKMIEKLIKLMDSVKLDELGVVEQIKEELNRYNKFKTGVFGSNQEKVDVKDADIRNYMKYILKDGGITEKRELLSEIQEEIVLSNKKLFCKVSCFDLAQ